MEVEDPQELDDIDEFINEKTNQIKGSYLSSLRGFLGHRSSTNNSTNGASAPPKETIDVWMGEAAKKHEREETELPLDGEEAQVDVRWLADLDDEDDLKPAAKESTVK